MMTDIEKLMKLTGETDTDLLELLLEDAEQFVRDYTNRTKLVGSLEKASRDIAVITYNRMGTEGEAKRSEGGESVEFLDIPPSVYKVLNKYRLLRIGGRTFERVEDDEAETEQD